jgi:hypothetical protein
VKEFLKKLYRYIRKYFLKYFGGPIEGILFQIDLEKRWPAKQPLVVGEFRIIGQEELTDFEKDLPYQQLDLFRQRFLKHGDTMVGYFVSSRLVYWGWVSFDNYYFEPDLNTSIKIPANAGYIYDTQTVPSFRRKGIHVVGICKLLDVIKQKGKERALILILSGNLPAIKAIGIFNPKLLEKIKKKLNITVETHINNLLKY